MGGFQYVLDFSSVGPCVHEHGAADAAGNSRCEFQPCQLLMCRLPSNDRQERSCTAYHFGSLCLCIIKGLSQLDDYASVAPVSYQNVRSVAQNHMWNIRQNAQHLFQLLRILRLHHEIRPAPCPERGVLRHRSILCYVFSSCYYLKLSLYLFHHVHPRGIPQPRRCCLQIQPAWPP